MEMAYNNTLHTTITTTPFALTYTFNPSLPFFDLLQPNTYYKGKPTDDLFQQIKSAFAKAYQHSAKAIKQQESYFN